MPNDPQNQLIALNEIWWKTQRPATSRLPTATQAYWWAEAAEENMSIVLLLIGAELMESHNIPPMPAAKLAEDLVSLAQILNAPPHTIKLWISDQLPGEISSAAYARWVERHLKLTGNTY